MAETVIKYGLVGERLSHSFSPEIHKALGGYEYGLIEISKEEVASFFKKREFSAVNVTIPYKETVIPLLDEISEAAREIGAVNTVINKDGRLFGYNTDCIGMMNAIFRVGIDIKDKKVLICGSGGTSKTALYVAKILGASEVYRLSRTERDGCITYEAAYNDHADAGIIINTTPLGMYPDLTGCPLDISRFEKLSGVFDAVFNPLRTNLVLSARERKIPADGGLFMLVSQAAKASELFLGCEIPSEKTEKVYRELFEKKENIVLVGMPSSGKTTVGNLISEATGRRSAGTDEVIRENEGTEIPEIFERYGEAYFRDCESRAVSEFSKIRGAVIATGGGAVLRDENVNNLRKNGRIYFIDRSLEKLICTSDRPLSKDREQLERLYRERIDIYRAVCDVIIDGDGTAEEVANTILKDFFER